MGAGEQQKRKLEGGKVLTIKVTSLDSEDGRHLLKTEQKFACLLTGTDFTGKSESLSQEQPLTLHGA